jgi:hypothetical protein
MHYGPDETLRRNRTFELPKSNRDPLSAVGIYGPNVWVFKDVCEQNHARMQCATQLGMLSSEALLRFQTGSTENEGKVKQ